MTDASIAEEIARGALNEGIRARWAHFSAWCEAHEIEAQPTLPHTLLLYLHAHYPRWRHSTARSAVSSVVAVNRHLGFPSPRSALVSRYLKILRTDPAIPEPQHKVDAIDPAQLVEVTLALAVPELDCVAVHRAALLALAIAAGRPIADVAVDPSCVTVTLTDVRVTLPDGGRVILGKAQAHLRDAVAAWASHPEATSLAEVGRPDGFCPVFRRAGVEMPDPTAAPALSVEDQRWLLRAVDPRLEKHLRDRAYVLTGFATALRHENLARFTVKDCTQGPGFVVLAVGPRKNDPDAKFGDERLNCPNPRSGCGLYHCAACAVKEWLTYLARQGRLDGSPLFATRYGGRLRSMTRQNARLVLRAMWLKIDPDAIIATRSMRAGAVTSAYAAGMDIDVIAATLSKHRTVSEAAGYLRLGENGITIRLDRADLLDGVDS